MSRDNVYIAVGFGTKVHLFKNAWQSSHILTVNGFASADNVKFQVANFSPDSQWLVVATQKYDSNRTDEDDAVYTYVWECNKISHGPFGLERCKMPTVRIGELFSK